MEAFAKPNIHAEISAKKLRLKFFSPSDTHVARPTVPKKLFCLSAVDSSTTMILCTNPA